MRKRIPAIVAGTALLALAAGLPVSAAGSLEELRAAEIAEARRLAARLDGLWPGLGQLARDTTILLIAEDGARMISEGEDARPGGEFNSRRRRIPAGGTAIRHLDVAGKRLLVLDERIEDPVRTLLLQAADSVSTSEASVGWVVAGLAVHWAQARLFDDPVAALFRPGSPPPEEASLLLRALQAAGSSETREIAREFFAVRRAWLASVPDLPAAAFHRAETERGLALHAAYIALLTGRNGGHSPGPEILEIYPGFGYGLAPALRERLSRRLARVAAGDLEAGGPAVSGFALALILDRTVPDWPRRLRSGEGALDRLLVGEGGGG